MAGGLRVFAASNWYLSAGTSCVLGSRTDSVLVECMNNVVGDCLDYFLKLLYEVSIYYNQSFKRSDSGI